MPDRELFSATTITPLPSLAASFNAGSQSYVSVADEFVGFDMLTTVFSAVASLRLVDRCSRTSFSLASVGMIDTTWNPYGHFSAAIAGVKSMDSRETKYPPRSL